jgi:hypothetical protein
MAAVKLKRVFLLLLFKIRKHRLVLNLTAPECHWQPLFICVLLPKFFRMLKSALPPQLISDVSDSYKSPSHIPDRDILKAIGRLGVFLKGTK